MTTKLREPMGRKRMFPEGEEPKKTTMKVEPGLLRKAKMVSTYREMEMFDYIDAILRPVVERDYDKMIQTEAKGEEGGRK